MGRRGIGAIPEAAKAARLLCPACDGAEKLRSDLEYIRTRTFPDGHNRSSWRQGYLFCARSPKVTDTFYARDLEVSNEHGRSGAISSAQYGRKNSTKSYRNKVPAATPGPRTAAILKRVRASLGVPHALR